MKQNYFRKMMFVPEEIHLRPKRQKGAKKLQKNWQKTMEIGRFEFGAAVNEDRDVLGGWLNEGEKRNGHSVVLGVKPVVGIAREF